MKTVRPAVFVAFVAALLLAACASLPEPDAGADSRARAARLLGLAAEAHGTAAFGRLHDISVAFDGEWAAPAGRVQPVLVDERFRGRSEERLLPAQDAIGQTHRGPGGIKQVFRDAAGVRVWYGGAPSTDAQVAAAAALVADGYRLFLLGPIWLQRHGSAFETAGEGRVDGRPCDWLLAMLRPGLGLAAEDKVALCIDRETHLMRRVRFSLEGLDSTRGAVAEVDVDGYVEHAGVRWPTRFVERLRRPVPLLPIHRWQLIGLDVDRGYGRDDIADGGGFRGAAAAPARPLAPQPARAAVPDRP